MQRLPQFDPTRWLPDATRQIDPRPALAPLLGLLAADDDGAGGPREAWIRDRQRQLAALLARDAPLHELSAALLIPYLRSVAGHWQLPTPGEEAARAARERLLALMAQRANRAADDDEWYILADRLWGMHVAWASTEGLPPGTPDALDRLDDASYRRLMADYFANTARATLLGRCVQVLLGCAQEYAQVLLEVLDLPSATRDRAEAILGLRPTPDPLALLPAAPPTAPTTKPPALREGHLPVLNSANYHALREALYLHRFDRVVGTPWPTATLASGRVVAIAQLRPPETGEFGAHPDDYLTELMWRQRQELSDLDADVLDYLSAAFLATAPQAHAEARIDDILLMRGIQPRHRGSGRRGGFTAEQRAEIAGALAHIANIELTITSSSGDFDDPDGAAGEALPGTIPVLRSRAFIVTSQLGRMEPGGRLVDMNHFTFRPGQVLEHFLLGPGQQTALLSAMALRYNPYTQKWEKRLARYLSWQWRVQARRGSYARPYRVATLLDRVGEAINERHPSRTRDRLEGALDRLQLDGVLGNWAYDRWDEERTGQPGWADDWGEATLLLEPPETIRQSYRALRRRGVTLDADGSAPRQLALPQAPPTGGHPPARVAVARRSPEELAALLKQTRQERALRQATVAQALGISQGHYSKLERAHADARSRTDELDAAIARWLSDVASRHA